LKDKNKQIEQYLEIIDEIEKVRTRNNLNWMDVLRLAFKSAPEEAKALIKKIDHEDNRISELIKKLSE
jgi:hypothetical protein|tara:strand:+ start:125 stop:328 length:204 start_codon:yes stop_codon:yes gene_type:complete